MSTHKRIILIADDEEMIRSLTADLVTSFGYDVLTASNGEEAVLVFSEHKERVGMVILDMSMPIKDGIQTFEELRQLDGGVRIVVSSGFADDPAIAKLIKKGAFGTLAKPFRIDDLISTLARAFPA